MNLVLLAFDSASKIATRYVKSHGLKVYATHRGLLDSQSNPVATLENFRKDPPNETRV